MIEFFIEREEPTMRLYKASYTVDGVIVSHLFFYTVKLPSRHLGVIEEVNTVEAYRRKGYATALIKLVIAKGRDMKLDCIELTVRQDKPEIQAFYKSLGFEDRLNHAYRLRLGGK